MANSLIVPPHVSVGASLQHAAFLKEHPGLKFGIPMIDEKVLPLRPGNLEFILARPGDGKTAFLSWRAKQAAAQLNGVEDKIVIYASWEQPREEIEFNLFDLGSAGLTVSDIYWGRAPIDVLKRLATQRNQSILVAGRSLRDDNTRAAPMTIETLFEACRSLKEDYGKSPALLCVDYLQRITPRPGRTRTEEVSEIVYGLKSLALDLGCPISIAAQATHYDGPRNTVRIPRMGDAWYTRVVDHEADVIWGCARIARYLKEGDFWEYAGKSYLVYEHLWGLELSKQRGENAFAQFALHFDMSRMDMRPIPKDKTPVVVENEADDIPFA